MRENMNTALVKYKFRIFQPVRLTIFIVALIFAFSGCSRYGNTQSNAIDGQADQQDTEENIEGILEETAQSSDEADTSSKDAFSFISTKGSTLESRINPPKGFTRIPSNLEEITGFMRGLALKESGSNVLLYDGTTKGNQGNHVAVFDLDLGDRDLQQCADSVIRVYAEYYWSIGNYDKIAFHLTNGFLMEYTKWRDGNRIVVDGNDVSWHKSREYNDSYETFHNYLDMVYSYAGTLSLSQECVAIIIDDLYPGDMFLQSGSPGHCVLVVDIAEDESGNRCFLLAQGYMPAQDFHVLKNPLHPEDPWYYVSEISFPLLTPAWSFAEGSPVRWSDFPLNEADTATIYSDDLAAVSTSSHSDAIPAISNKVQTVKEPHKSQVTLLAVGDNLIHTQVVKSGKQEDGSYNYDHLYSNLKEDISSADIAIINQETILGGDEFAYSGYPIFNSPTEIGDAVIEAGFDVVLHATNHTMDKGLDGVLNTFEYWKLHTGITVLGINESEEGREEIPIIEKNGIKIAMLNYTYGLNGYQVPKGKPYLVNMLDKNSMEADIKRATQLSDFVIVFPHWGTEYVYEATKSQVELTEFFYELGVDLVIGTHPHVLEPVEWIETNEEHRMLVYYSLGNFISYQREAPRMLGGIANITITKDDSGTYISDAGITPIVTHYENGPTDYNYGIYKLTEYTDSQALLHGVLDHEKQGLFTYQGTFDLAEQVLGSWFQEDCPK